METYIGTKMLDAKPMSKGEYNSYRGWPMPLGEDPAEPGYLVRYPDGYESWSPKKTFEAAYLPLIKNDSLKSDAPSISEEMVKDFIREVEVTTMGDRTTVVRAVLRNGFVLVESSSCVSPENYDEKLGAEICLEKIEDAVWLLLGFLLQTAVHGI